MAQEHMTENIGSELSIIGSLLPTTEAKNLLFLKFAQEALFNVKEMSMGILLLTKKIYIHLLRLMKVGLYVA